MDAGTSVGLVKPSLWGSAGHRPTRDIMVAPTKFMTLGLSRKSLGAIGIAVTMGRSCFEPLLRLTSLWLFGIDIITDATGATGWN